VLPLFVAVVREAMAPVVHLYRIYEEYTLYLIWISAVALCRCIRRLCEFDSCLREPALCGIVLFALCNFELTNGGAAGILSPERVGFGCPMETRRVGFLVRAYLVGICVIFVFPTIVVRSDYLEFLCSRPSRRRIPAEIWCDQCKS
jgi:hypothetical protein